jgi:hypothetical protein
VKGDKVLLLVAIICLAVGVAVLLWLLVLIP